MSTPLSEKMDAVAHRLLGEPNPRLSTNRELRFGAKGSLSVDLKKGTYFDHENNAGGGVLDLIRCQVNSDPIDWLRNEGLIRQDTVVATFDYKDERGLLLFQVCRTAAKKILAAEAQR